MEIEALRVAVRALFTFAIFLAIVRVSGKRPVHDGTTFDFVFSILLVIQFVVITNGAGRVAEVGARFTLDAMPGKQMAIDADLNSGLIDEEEARRRRAEVHAEADFHGAMDGASKFVKGDAIAAIVITLVNLLGGFAIGVAQKGMPFGEAINTYSLLSIGDGLVSQVPALLLSVATGLIVTRQARPPGSSRTSCSPSSCWRSVAPCGSMSSTGRPVTRMTRSPERSNPRARAARVSTRNTALSIQRRCSPTKRRCASRRARSPTA